MAIAIPADIKSKNLPFGPLNFSFRNKENFNQIQIFPSSYKDLFQDTLKDIGYQQLYPMNSDTTITTDTFNLDHILDFLPGIKIREYLPHSKLDQAFNLLEPVTKKFMDFIKSDGDFFEKFDLKKWWDKLKKLPDTVNTNIISDTSLNKNTEKYIWNYYDNSAIKSFVFNIYYLLQTSTTQNYYVLPGITSSKELYSSNGSAGWIDGNSRVSFVPDMIKNIPMLGSIVNNLFGNVGIDYMPWWNPDSGSKTTEPEIKIEFDLFNDSYTATINNFKFIHTLIPGNRWIQYGILKHSSNIYDIQLEGYNRLFACAGDFSVTYKGILREPPRDLKYKLEENAFDTSKLYAFDQLKIPDVYHVTMTFKSLLPANFNTYLFNIMSRSDVTTIKGDSKSSIRTLSDIVTKTADTLFGKGEEKASPNTKTLNPASPSDRATLLGV